MEQRTKLATQSFRQNAIIRHFKMGMICQNLIPSISRAFEIFLHTTGTTGSAGHVVSHVKLDLLICEPQCYCCYSF